MAIIGRILVACECRLPLVLDYSTTIGLVNRGTGAHLVDRRRCRIWLRRGVAPSGVRLSRLAALRDQGAVFIAFQITVAPSFFRLLLLQILHLDRLHRNSLLYCLVFLDQGLDVDCSSVIFLLKTHRI
jgi:hypothetical protein